MTVILRNVLLVWCLFYTVLYDGGRISIPDYVVATAAVGEDCLLGM